MPERTAFFVQFPPPGPEHRPRGPLMPWNVGDHRRKFLRAPGRYLRDEDAAVVAADLVFWGEWEPPSEVVDRWSARDDLPRWLHLPYWERPTTAAARRQNTDPWVFGDRMLYSNCRQTALPALQHLGLVRCARVPTEPAGRLWLLR